MCAGLADLQVLSTLIFFFSPILVSSTVRSLGKKIMWIVIDYDRGRRGSI